MGAPQQTLLPLELFDRLCQVRHRFAEALSAAGRGDYSREAELRGVSRYLGQLLAGMAGKGTAERGGLSIVELAITIDRAFPEMRGWNRYIAANRTTIANQASAKRRSTPRGGKLAS
jgi:hypothetical protein